MLVISASELGDPRGPVVCGVRDCDPAALQAALTAAAVAQDTSRSLVLAHCMTRATIASRARAMEEDEVQKRLQELEGHMEGALIEHVTFEGRVASQLAELAARRQADLLVVGSSHPNPLTVATGGCTPVDLPHSYDGALLVVPARHHGTVN